MGFTAATGCCWCLLVAKKNEKVHPSTLAAIIWRIPLMPKQYFPSRNRKKDLHYKTHLPPPHCVAVISSQSKRGLIKGHYCTITAPSPINQKRESAAVTCMVIYGGRRKTAAHKEAAGSRSLAGICASFFKLFLFLKKKAAPKLC